MHFILLYFYREISITAILAWVKYSFYQYPEQFKRQFLLRRHRTNQSTIVLCQDCFALSIFFPPLQMHFIFIIRCFTTFFFKVLHRQLHI